MAWVKVKKNDDVLTIHESQLDNFIANGFVVEKNNRSQENKPVSTPRPRKSAVEQE